MMLLNLPDHGVILVVGVVGVSQFAIRPELELQELVPELALVAHVVTQVEIVAHLLQEVVKSGVEISNSEKVK